MQCYITSDSKHVLQSLRHGLKSPLCPAQSILYRFSDMSPELHFLSRSCSHARVADCHEALTLLEG
eukprot:scaffold140655_cov39-Prasinocladus_malaysianus.AAC.1